MASDAYMEISDPDVWGETFDDRFGMTDSIARRLGAYEISSFSMSATSNKPDPDDQAPTPAVPPQTGGRQQPSTPTTAKNTQTTIREFTVKKAIDAASPNLFQCACAQNKMTWAVITLREAGDPSRQPWLIVEFTDLFVQSFNWELEPAASGDEVKGQETVTFRFSTIKFKYSPQTKTGEHGAMKISAWNRLNHTPDGVPDLASEGWGGS